MAEEKEDKSAISKIAKKWHDFFNTKIQINVPRVPVGVIPTFSGDVAPASHQETIGSAMGKAAGAAVAPATIAGAVTAGVPATLVGLGAGVVGGAAGSAAGSKGAELLGSDKYTQEMFGDLGSFAGGLIGGGTGIKGLNLMKPKVRNYRLAKAISKELDKGIQTQTKIISSPVSDKIISATQSESTSAPPTINFFDTFKRHNKYLAKLLDQNTIGVFNLNNNQVGKISLNLRSDGNLGIHHIERFLTLPKGEYFQQIGLEAVRQYGKRVGRKAVTGNYYASDNPVAQMQHTLDGFKLHPLRERTRIYTTDPQEAVESSVLKQALDDPSILRISILDDIKDISKIPTEATELTRSSFPEFYDRQGNLKQKSVENYRRRLDDEGNFVLDELLPEHSIPGMYESIIVKPRKDFGVKFKFKQGGQMNYLDFFKNGGIHIKKANKGKFTEYCNGKVTEECIERGKHSTSAAVRKRATFAENARKWKH